MNPVFVADKNNRVTRALARTMLAHISEPWKVLADSFEQLRERERKLIGRSKCATMSVPCRF